ncbi:hypothetical protein C0993_005133 [Termitomyces sp. T159_Od127]|nr:hypothetical protein C0993_005133 [Termitomyces sp. T159_Od127]
MKAVVFPAPPEQVAVVVVPTDPCTPVQYNRIVATTAAKKGRQSEEEEKEEEGKTPAQHFQCVQWNKKITEKKANKAKATAILAHQAQNDFSGHIPDGLRVKIWGPLNVEQFNSCFQEAIGPCCYYSYQMNTVFVSTKTNWVAAFKFNSGQQAKIPGMMVYTFAHCGFPSMPFELEWLHKYYVNPNVQHHNHVVAYMLLTILQEFTWKCNVSLQDCTMKLLCDNPGYQEMVNPMQGPEDFLLVERCQILSHFLCIKEDRTSALRIMHMPDLNMPFDLEQLAQYALIFSRPGMENTWQGRRALFGFALCQALYTNSAGKTMLIHQLAPVMAWPGLYHEVVDTFTKVYEKLFKGQCGAQLSIFQVHVPDD